MASHFKWYPSSEEIVVPWNARYSFPSQANKAVKMTPRIPPKAGQTFAPGQIIRIEFPAQGYVNPTNTTLEFDVTLVGAAYNLPVADPQTAYAWYSTRFQNNIQSIFQRVRILYGATPLEDLLNYNIIVRCLTEWTSTNQTMSMDQTSIAEGIGGAIFATDAGGSEGIVHVRQNFIQGVSLNSTAPVNLTGGLASGSVPNGQSTLPGVVIPSASGPAAFANAKYSTRRYQVNLATGLFTQDKLIPVKFMASQLAIEITLEQPKACIFHTEQLDGAATRLTDPTYYVGNVNLIPEILEFDASYDAMFLRGLREGGVPIKFSSWHTFLFSSAQASNINLQIQERSRSVKALFAVQRLSQPYYGQDMGATLFDTASNGLSSLQSYQFRIGGRYFPAAPVQCALTLGSATTNGAAEAYVELQKALNCVGDYRLSTSANVLRWGQMATSAGLLHDSDYNYSIVGFTQTGGNAGTGIPLITSSYAPKTNAFVTTVGSQCFAMAIDLETSNGMEISGLNAEEQSDISLLAQWYAPQVSGGFVTASALEVYSYFDAMIVLRENNVLELIQ
jgi:hypothetical protein